MRTLSTLKSLVTIYYYLMLLLFFIGLVTVPLFLFIGKKFEVTIMGDVYDLASIPLWKSGLILILITVIYAIYFLAIKHIKHCVDHIASGNYFTRFVANGFRKIGKLFIMVGFGVSIVKIIIKLILSSSLTFSLDNTFFVLIILGFFFMFLSEAFLKGLLLKQENELTV